LIGVIAAGATVLAACGSSSGTAGADSVTIVLNTPSGKMPFIGTFTQQGAKLAADEINKAGGITVGGKKYQVKLLALDNGLSSTTSMDNVKRAVSEKAVAIIDDGYTARDTAKIAGDAGIPIMVDWDTTAELIDPTARPNVYRIAPPNDSLSEHLAAYVAPKGLKLAIVHDDTEYADDGVKHLTEDFGKANARFDADIELPSSATGYATQALQAKQSGATGIVLWAQAPALAQFVKDYRAGGGTAKIFSGANAEDPIVRSQNADHPEYIEGLTYATFRITTEGGPEAWNAFRGKYEDAALNNGEGEEKLDFKTPKGRTVVQPPDWQIFPYDMVYLVKAALEKAGTVDTSGNKLIDALNGITIKSANGDNRGWTKDLHEGVVDDDIYFASFVDMKFKPVQDDPLSKTLPPLDQE
jgi:ABC-type branched-subunit amino acid transport system substrate-binding protein